MAKAEDSLGFMSNAILNGSKTDFNFYHKSFAGFVDCKHIFGQTAEEYKQSTGREDGM